jgi:hypothetical protein
MRGGPPPLGVWTHPHEPDALGALMADTAPYTAPRRSTAGRIAAIVTGSMVALVAIGLLAAGGLALWANGEKDASGYITTGPDHFATSTYALATENLDIDGDIPGWVGSSDRYGKVRLTASSREGKPVFVGIARTSDVSAYLSRSAHAVVSDFSTSPFRATYSGRSGTQRPATPGSQGIWAASSEGAGTQKVTWDVRHGNWSVVVMNADGSRGVDAGVSAGADVPILSTVGWGSLGGGLLLLTVAGGLLFIGLRTPRTPRSDAGGTGLVPAATA